MAQIAVRTQQKNAFQPRSYRQHASHQRIRDYFMQGIKSSRVMSYSFESGFSLQNEIGGSLPSDAEVSAIFEPLWERLTAIESVVSKKEWNGESDPPSALSLSIASQILDRLTEVAFFPSGITASAEGGIGIYFEQDRKYADIEVLNSGKLLGVTSDRAGVIVPFEVAPSFDGYDKAITRVREFFAA
jgi:hypothetical protein